MVATENTVGHKQPLLSLITPCLNAAETITENLNSILKLDKLLRKNKAHIEHIIIDGGSTDGTLELINIHKKRLGSCMLVPNVKGGPYQAMNAGLARATGTYTHILNADDIIWNAELYAKIICAASNNNIEIILGSIAYFKRPNNNVISKWEVTPLPSDLMRWHKLLRTGHHYPHPGFICRTSTYRRTSFDTSYRYSSDYKLMQNILLNCDNLKLVYATQQIIVGMAKGGLTDSWSAIIQGQVELSRINKELNINQKLPFRYLSKLNQRYIKSLKHRLLNCLVKESAKH